MDFKFLVNSIKKIIHNPVMAWDDIYSENKSVKLIIGSLLFPLIILTAVSAFLGSFLFTNTELLKVYSVFTGVKYFILIFLVICGTAFIFKEITSALGLGRDFNLSFRLIAYSLIPFLICQIVSRLFESFIFINVLALFGLYIFWTGMEKLLNPPEKKKLPLLIATTLTFIIVFIAVSWFLTMVFDKFYFALFT